MVNREQSMTMHELHPDNSVYRKDIDGLRAIAVLSVILFHSGIPGLDGGYVGVDVFFVISGYLISQRIIYGELLEKFRFKDFYVRRIRRLFPAMLSTCFATLLAGCVLLPPDALMRLGVSAVSSALSLANIHFFLQAGYWDAAASSKPLLHMWSLSVEEQFYFVWPALILLILRYARNTSFFVIAIIAAASVALTTFYTGVDKSAAFYLTPFRIYEFAFGALCVWHDGFKWPERFAAKLVQNGLFALGLALIIGAIALFDEQTAFPGAWATIPATGTAFVILAKAPQKLGFLLTNPAARYIGLISYSLYLVHWPILVFMGMSATAPPAGDVVLALFLMIALAATQYHLIETPLRKPVGRRKTPLNSAGAFIRTAVTAATGVLAIALAATIIIANKGFPGRYAEQIQQIASLTSKDINLKRGASMRALCGRDINAPVCGKVVPGKVNILIAGDSHAVDGLNAFQAAYPEANFLFSMLSGCPLLLQMNDIVHGNKKCSGFNRRRLAAIGAQINTFDAIVISQRMRPDRIKETKKTVAWIADRGAKVIVLGAGPEFNADLVPLIAQYGTMSNLDAAMNEYAITTQFLVDSELSPYVLANDGIYIAARPFFCGTGPCRTVMNNGMPLMYDSHHLTLSAAQEFGVYIRRQYGEIASVFAARSDQERRIRGCATHAATKVRKIIR